MEPKNESKRVPEITVRSLLKSPTVTIRDTHCQGTCRHKSTEECTATTQLVFAYRGVYVRHVGHDQAVAEANQVLFFNATEGYRISHPVEGGDASLTSQPAPQHRGTSGSRRPGLDPGAAGARPTHHARGWRYCRTPAARGSGKARADKRSGAALDVGRDRRGSTLLSGLSHAGVPTSRRLAPISLPVAATIGAGAGSSRAL